MDLTFVPYDESMRESWDAFVEANPHAWPGHDSAIVDFERAIGSRSLSHLALDKSGRTVAVAPLFLQSERLMRVLRQRTLTTGNSLRGAPLLDARWSPGHRGNFWKAWAKWIDDIARRERVDSVHVAFPHLFGDQPNTELYDYCPLRDEGYRDPARLALIVDMNDAPENLIEILKQNCRTSCRRAQSRGGEFELIEDRREWMDLYALNLETFRGELVPPYTREAMEVVWDGFVARGRAGAFALRYRDEIISALITVGTPHSQYYWIGFNRRPPVLSGTTNMLYFKTMEWWREQGMRYIELGSLEFGDPRQVGIANFKRSFGGRIHHAMQCSRVFRPRKAAAVDFLRAMLSRGG